MTRIGVRRAVERDAARIAEARMASWRAAYRGIVLGGVSLPMFAYGWTDLLTILTAQGTVPDVRTPGQMLLIRTFLAQVNASPFA